MPFLGLALWFVFDLGATTCLMPPVCNRVRDQVLIAGIVTRVERTKPAGEPPRKLVWAHEVEYDHVATVRVTEWFSGLKRSTGTVLVPFALDGMRVGETYLIDGGFGNDSRLYPAFCGSSGRSDGKDVSGFLDFLRLYARGETPTSLTVRVASAGRMIEGVSVSLSSGGKVTKLATGNDGQADFESLPSGEYRVEIEKPGYGISVDGRKEAQSIRVRSGLCNDHYIPLQSQASVSGRLVQANGEPAPGQLVQLRRVDAEEHDDSLSTATGPGGTFRFEHVNPGRYHLGTASGRYSSATLPPSFYPGFLTVDRAVAVTVGDGEAVDGLDYSLPDFGPRRPVIVQAVFPDGKPAAGVEIYREGTYFPVPDTLFTGADGMVSVEALARLRYEMRARAYDAAGVVSHLSEAVAIEPGTGPARIRILLLPRNAPPLR